VTCSLFYTAQIGPKEFPPEDGKFSFSTAKFNPNRTVNSSVTDLGNQTNRPENYNAKVLS
jgi:hypothetical protein